jgi:hypothetical protein
MNNLAEQWQQFTKRELIKGLQKFLKENKMFRTKADGYKNLKGNGLERPEVDGIHYSWNEFFRMPKDVIIVYCFMKGCSLDYLLPLKEADWFNRRKNYRERKIAEGWDIYYAGGEFHVQPPEKIAAKKSTASNVRGRS